MESEFAYPRRIPDGPQLPPLIRIWDEQLITVVMKKHHERRSVRGKRSPEDRSGERGPMVRPPRGREPGLAHFLIPLNKVARASAVAVVVGLLGKYRSGCCA